MSGRLAVCDSTPNIKTCLSRSQNIGLIFIAAAGLISFAALLLLTVLVVRNIIRYYRYFPGKWNLIQTPQDAYIMSLFFSDILQSFGAVMDVKWAHQGFVQIGTYCTAQGAIQQLGETATALASTNIALYTFFVVWLQKGSKNMTATYCIIASTWIFVILFVSTAAGMNRNYYNPDTYWCWVGGQRNLLAYKIAGEYLWLWLALLMSLLVYVPLFLWSRGFLTQDESAWWRVKLHRRAQIRASRKNSRLAILAYPLAYTIVVLPVSITRWAFFTGHQIPDAATFFSIFMFDIFGSINVMLLLTTRPNLLLFADPRKVLGLAEQQPPRVARDGSLSTPTTQSKSGIIIQTGVIFIEEFPCGATDDDTANAARFGSEQREGASKRV